jgi:hypothetical protein
MLMIVQDGVWTACSQPACVLNKNSTTTTQVTRLCRLEYALVVRSFGTDVRTFSQEVGGQVHGLFQKDWQYAVATFDDAVVCPIGRLSTALASQPCRPLANTWPACCQDRQAGGLAKRTLYIR